MAFWRWQLTRDKAQWPKHIENKTFDKPPPRVTDGARIDFVGHASLFIQSGGLNILIDPVWSEHASPVAFLGPTRVCAPGIAFDDLRVSVLDWHGRVVWSESVAATLVPTQHWTARGLFDRNKALWGGFVIETPAGKIYHVTDTGYNEPLFRETRDRYGPFRLAIIPIGAYEPRWFMLRQHVNPEEAVRVFQDFGAEQALAHHFGTFQLTDEAIDAPVDARRAACAAANIPPEIFVVPEPGSVLELKAT